MLFKKLLYMMLNAFKPFQAATWSNWRDAINSHIYVLVGSLLPIWLSPFLLKTISVEFKLTDFVDHGELALYSAALISPAIYIIIKNRKNTGFPYNTQLIILSICVLLISCFVFAGVIVTSIKKTGLFILNISFLRSTTIILLVFSVLLSYLVSVFDNLLTSLDLSDIKGKEMKELENKFNETERQ